MTTITTTDLSWSATWSRTPTTSDSSDYINARRSVVSNTSEETSAFNSTSNNDEIILSKEAQEYTNNNSSQITDTTGTIQKIYDSLGKIISSSTTSEDEKWNAFEVADELRAEYMENQGIYGLDLSFNQETENSPFMQKINAANDYINSGKDIAANPLATKLFNLWGKEGEILSKESCGSSSFSIKIQETTIHTDSGDVTSFQLSSNFNSHSNIPLVVSHASALDTSTSATSASVGHNIQTLSFSGKTGDLNAELDKEIVEELFGSSNKDKVSLQKETRPDASNNVTGKNNINTTTADTQVIS